MGSNLFGEVYEGYFGWGYRGAGGGVKYFGTMDSVFSEYGVFVGGRLKGLGVGLNYTSISIGSYRESFPGGMVSFGKREKLLDVWVSFGYISSPIVAFEGNIKSGSTTFTVSAVSRPGMYIHTNFKVILEFDAISVGGIYSPSGNSFGIMVLYNYGFSRLYMSAISHQDLGEVFGSGSVIIIPQ